MFAFARLVILSLTVPVRILDDAPVDPLLQDFEVRDTGCFGEVQAELLSLAVTREVEGSVMKKTQSRPTHTLSFIHRGCCENSRSSSCFTLFVTESVFEQFVVTCSRNFLKITAKYQPMPQRVLFYLIQ